MSISKALAATGIYASSEQFDVFQKHIREEWIEEALAKQKTEVKLRRRRLPAGRALWLVIGIALFRNQAMYEVVGKLELALPDKDGREVARSAIVGARARLGVEPVEVLFRRTAVEWAKASAEAHGWRGLSIYGVDGSTVRVADTPENRAELGGQSAGVAKGDSGYPMVRIVTVMALRSHLLLDACFGGYRGSSEAAYAERVLPSIPNDSLTIFDRGFFNAPTLVPLAREGTNRHWLTRAKKNTRIWVFEELGPGDAIVEMKVTGHARKKDPSLPKTWRMRAIATQRAGHAAQLLLTSLLDPERYPSRELIDLYHERWELELGYDELLTELLDREETIRSKSPAGVRQEVFGILVAFNLVRLEMEGVAKDAGVPPTRISFVMALTLVRDLLTWGLALASPGVVPRRLRDFRANLARYVLPKRRSERSYPRAVKIKMSNYARKRPSTLPSGARPTIAASPGSPAQSA